MKNGMQKTMLHIFLAAIFGGLIFIYKFYNYLDKFKTKLVFLPKYVKYDYKTVNTGIWAAQNAPYCNGILHGDEYSIRMAKMDSKKDTLQNEDYLEYFAYHTCDNYRRIRKYRTTASLEESKFPIAFSMLVYKDIEQVERLLRMIYSPSNYYCIHIDQKAPSLFKYALKNVTNCFKNVFVSKISYDIYWGHYNILQAEMACIKMLYKKEWMYFINLTGQEVPLVTNQELVRMLKSFNGANNVGRIMHVSRSIKKRWTYIWEFKHKTNGARNTGKLKGSPPYNITIYKGSTHVALSRNFVKFILNDRRATELYQWLNNTYIPDETFFATLNNNKHLCPPGGFADLNHFPTYLTRYKIWITSNKTTCGGKIVRDICIFGVEDVKNLIDNTGRFLFANKMYFDYQHLAYDCMEEYIRNRTTFLNSQKKIRFNVRWIKKLNFVKKIINCTTISN